MIPVRYAFTNEVNGCAPATIAEHVRSAFEIAATYRPKLTRYERGQILQRTGELIGQKRE